MNLLPILVTRVVCAFSATVSFVTAALVFAADGNGNGWWPLATAFWCSAYWFERERAVKFCAELQALVDLVRKEVKS